MKISTKLLVTCLIFWLFQPFQVKAQVQGNDILLHDAIIIIEKEYDVQFNYAEETIEGVYVASPNLELDIESVLINLQNQTALTFSRLDDHFILIKSKVQNTFCGYVKSFYDDIPIPLATIQNGSNGAVADANGYFELNLMENNKTIEVRALGYRTVQLDLALMNANDCMIIRLNAELQTLSEVYISNYITKGINKLNDGSFNINIEDFEILPGLIDADVLRSVQAFPGIMSVSETVSNINIRGGSHDQNLILWDNIKMYQSGHFFGLISMYNPQITQTVSLFKNGTSTQFSDGVSGTIAMYTENKLNKTFKGNFGVNLIDANAFVDIPLGNKSSLQLAARKSISDFTKTPTYEQFFKRISQNNELQSEVTSDKQFDFYDASLRWIYQISPKDELKLNFINVSNNLVFNENALVNNIETSRESNISQKSIAAGLNYKRLWSSQFNTTLQVYETDYKLEAVNSNINESQRFLQKNQVSESSIKLLAEKVFNQNLNGLFGYHFVETKITNLDDVDVPRYKFLISEVLREHSVFSEFTFRTKNKKTHVDLGLRYNYIDKFQEHILEPRLSITHQLSNRISVEALGEFKHQNTSQVINFQNDFLGVEKRRWQLTDNDSIPIIKSKQFSLGINYEHQEFLISAETYYKKVDGITSQSQGFQNNFEFIKTSGNYDVLGLDFLIKKQLNDFNLWVSYTYMDNNYTFKTFNDEAFPSNFDISHTLTFGSGFTTNKFKLAAGINWHTGKPITEPIANETILNGSINYDSVNSSNLEDYFRVDLSAIYYLNLGHKLKGEIGASIWNVFGNENTINSFYRLNNSQLIRVNELSLGFAPNVSARIIF
ncbi:TonB-dependent receptor [Hanstruepera ponticola]|uniref:TonB-dependent receptor n=1 Tax=Hanstruepera ponticola TaxID=2042995 RepID=UPI000CF1081B|nr:carboxypeptidase-like regulatory domain-containing protein [Hanstruepera ponticola]